MTLTECIEVIQDFEENIYKRFNHAAALYYYCIDNHDGPRSIEHKLLKEFNYRPGEIEYGLYNVERRTIYKELRTK